jgi:hypothetical protein
MSTYRATAPRTPFRGRTQGVAGQTLAGLLLAVAAAGLTAYVSHRATASAAAAVLVVVGSIWFATTRRPQLALVLLMLYLGLLDGYLKLATGSNLVTFVRDALLYALVVGLLIRATVQGKRLPVPPLSGWVLAFVVLALVQILNPGAGSLIHSVAGLRQNLEFIPLFFLTYAFVRTTKALRMFVIVLAVIAAANGIVNLVQFHLTPQQLASWGPGYSQRVIGTGKFEAQGRAFYDTSGTTHTRPFGLMSDAGTGGLVCAFALGGILALASMRTTRRHLVPAALAAGIAVAGIFVSQGRAVIVCAVTILLAYALLSTTARRNALAVLAAAAVIGVSSLVVFAVVGTGASPLRYQGLTPGGIVHLTNQQRGTSIAQIPHNLIHHPLGAGLGIGGPAAGVSGAPSAEGADTESEISFATLETGIPGMLVIVGFTVALVALGVKRCRHEPDPEARVLLAAIIAPLAGMLVLYAVNALTPTTPGGPYLWSVGGIVAYWLVARPAELAKATAAPAASE